jgi:hypothetical protein
LELVNDASRNSLAIFRISSHNLMVEAGRAMGLEHQQRYCPFCRPQRDTVEDESHFIFHCTIYNDVRTIHSSLFTGIEFGAVGDFLQQVNQGSLADFFKACWARRQEEEEKLEEILK